MAKKKLYSVEFQDWVEAQLSPEMVRVMHKNGWNVFGVYELVKAGLSLERRGKFIADKIRKPEVGNG